MPNCSVSPRTSTVANALRSGLCKPCCRKCPNLRMRSVPGADRGPRAGSPRGVVDATGSLCDVPEIARETRSLPLPVLTPCCRKSFRGETMNRVTTITFRLLVASLVFWSCLATATEAQTSSPSPAPSATPAAQPANPFAPQPAPPLPAGMTGSDRSDPRAKLSPGMYDAGETAMGIKHLLLLKKPDAFDLGSNDPNDPKVNNTLSTVLGVADPSKMPSAMKLVLAGLGFANSDIAFQGNRLFLGNFYGVNIYDISNPAKTTLLTSMICPGVQGDVAVYKNLMFMSVEMANGRIDCGIGGFPPNPPP